MRSGEPAYDVAQLLAGLVLLCSFALLSQRRAEALPGLLAAQGALLAAAAAWQGWVQGAPQLHAAALIALAAQGVLIPLALARAMPRRRSAGGLGAAPGVGPTLLLAVALVALALLVAPPSAAGAGQLARAGLGVALAVALLGLLLMVTRRDAIAQVVGLISVGNGAVLAAVGVAGLPRIVELSIAGLVLAAALVAGLVAGRLGERAASPGADSLEPGRGGPP